jgi:hypothetical protein
MGFWNNFFKKSQSKKKVSMSTLTLECPRCGVIYHVGEDAGIMTMEHVFKDYASHGSSVTIISNGSPPARPDLVISINCDTQQEKDKAKKAAREILSQIRHDLRRRTWYCQKCMNTDSPYKYPNI